MSSTLSSILPLFLLLLLSCFLSSVHTATLAPTASRMRVPVPRRGWADSYSAGGKCYCMSTFDHGIGNKRVRTPVGRLTVREVCRRLGKGPGVGRNPIYNDIQCGHGPPKNAPDERLCPGRVDRGRRGCRQKGPRWDLSSLKPRKKGRM